MTELFTQLTIPLRTWDETIMMGATEGNPQGADQASGGLYVGGRYVGGTLEGASYMSSLTGARFEILPESDLTIGCVAYDAAGTVVFKVLVSGTDKGDVIIGNYAGGQGAKWDDSAGTFVISGALNASSINIPDTATANSFHVDSTGNAWWGSILIAGAIAKVLNTGAATFTSISITGGVIDGTSTIGGRLASVLNTAIDASGHFADSAISTASGTILGNFTFNSTDFAGSLKTGDITWNAGTGAITGGSGIVVSKAGIIGASVGVVTFSINGTTGVITGNGLVVGTNVGIGTAVASADMTTIVGGIVTTEYIYAKDVTAQHVSASISITTPTITGGTITIGTSNNVFIAGASGIQLGHATFGSAPFSVNMAGALVASSATITGALTTAAGSSINGTYIDSLVANKITAGTGIINALSVLTTLTMGSAATDGYIQSYGWDGTVNGFQIKGGATPTITLIGGTITGGTIRTAASPGARVEMSAANNRLDIYNATPTNIGWFGGIGANGNFMYINQPDTNEDYPPVYITSAQDSNVINAFNTNASLANRPAFRFESNNVLSEAMYVKQTANYLGLVAETNSAAQAALYVVQLGTSLIINTNVSGCYLTKAGVWTDASSKKLKENFENLSVLDRLADLDIKKYNYIAEAPRSEVEVREYLIDSKKREKYSKTDEGRKDGCASEGYLKIKLIKDELDEIDQKMTEELSKERSRVVSKHFTPMAEDFNRVFGLGDNKGISPGDVAGVALQAIKELNQRVDQLETKIKKL